MKRFFRGGALAAVILTFSSLAVRADTLDEVRRRARAQSQPLWSAAKSIVADGELAARARNALAGFLALVDAIDEETRELSLQDVLEGFDIRCKLEPYVLELASQHMPRSLIKDMISRIDRLDKTDYAALLAEA